MQFFHFGVNRGRTIRLPVAGCCRRDYGGVDDFLYSNSLILESTNELIDAGLAPEQVQDIRDYINSLNGVENLHFLRTRRMGGQVLADVHLQVDGRLSVSESITLVKRRCIS